MTQVAVAAGHLDRDQDVAGFERVAGAALDFNEVVSEGAVHRLGECLEREGGGGGGEGGIELRLGHDPKVSPEFPGDRIGGLALGHLVAQRPGSAERGGGIALIGQARYREIAEKRRAGVLELVLVGAVILFDFLGRDGHRLDADRDGWVHPEARDLDLLLFVLVSLPERRIGHEHVSNDAPNQLAAQQLVAVPVLEIRNGRLPRGRSEPPLILGGIEPAIGLELRALGELAERGGTYCLGHLIG